jgi:hypothetical protein
VIQAWPRIPVLPYSWWTEKRDPPPVTVTGVLEREYYCVEKLHDESWPGLPVTANLYVPKRREGRVPGAPAWGQTAMLGLTPLNHHDPI